MDGTGLNEAPYHTGRIFRLAVMAALLSLVALVGSVIGLQMVQGAALETVVKESRLQSRRDAILTKIEKVRGRLDELTTRLEGLEKVADDNLRRLDVIESGKK